MLLFDTLWYHARMIREDVCRADDFATQERLIEVLRRLGFLADDTWHDEPSFGLGVSRYRKETTELTVFRDAWMVDIAGPVEIVNELLEQLASPH
jgi:hypothetical protein